MQLARFVRTMGLSLALILAGSGIGCSPATQEMSEAENQDSEAIHKASHKQLKEMTTKTKDAMKRGARRGG